MKRKIPCDIIPFIDSEIGSIPLGSTKNPEREDVRDFLIDNKHHIVYYYT